MCKRKIKTYNVNFIQAAILITLLGRIRSCAGRHLRSNDNVKFEAHQMQRTSKEKEENEDSFAKANIITSEVSPWQLVEPQEPGFDLNEKEMEDFRIWPAGIIPYFIDDYSFDKTMSSRLRLILNAVNSVTGLRFMELAKPPDDPDARWVFFINRRGVLSCEDYSPKNFTTKGVQRVVVGYDCVLAGGGALAPTVLALAGVPPQHNAPDRDKYITVNMDNIIPEKRHLFQKLRDNEWLFHDMKYDFLSSGHYDFHKYTNNGKATIKPKFKVNAAVGEGDGISYNDIWKIKMLYNYITARNTIMSKNPNCAKLFKVKQNMKPQQTQPKEIKITPREKPAKYLGAGTNNSTNEQTQLENKEKDSEKLKKPKNKKPVKKPVWWDRSDFNTSDDDE